MNQKITTLLVAAACSLLTLTHSAHAQGTAFTYQGRLNSGTNTANGTYDVQFTLYSVSSGGSAIAGPVVKTGIGVTNGLFATTVDFGGVFPGATNWLELAVRTNGGSSFSPALTPRQQLTPTPYAVYAESANASNLVGTVPAANLSGVAQLAGGNAFTGNQSVTSGAVGIGTTSPQGTVEIHNNGGRNLVLSGPGGATWSFYDSTANGYGWDIAGSISAFSISDSGVGYPLTILRPSGNVGIGTTTPSGNLSVATSAGTLSVVGDTAVELVPSGGVADGSLRLRNRLELWPKTNLTASGYIDVRGTNGNPNITLNGSSGLVTANSVGIGTTTPSGNLSVATSAGTLSVVGDTAVELVPSGGVADGSLRLRHRLELWPKTDLTASGYIDLRDTNGNPTVTVDGSSGLVTANSVGIGTTTPVRQLTVKALGYGIEHTDGNVRLDTYLDSGGGWLGTVSAHNLNFFVNDGGAAVTIDLNQNMYVTGEVTCTALNITSDRNAKEEFKPVDPLDVLAKVVTLPISEWQYKTEADARHIGPMAQDFREAFALGHDEKHISTVDEGGVALAAIQGLNEKLVEKDVELQRLKSENEALAGRLAAIERALGLAQPAAPAAK